MANGKPVRIEDVEALIQRSEGRIMGYIDDIRSELTAINGVTNEIAADVQSLLDLVTGFKNGMTQAEAEEVKQQLAALKARLLGVASQHTP